MLLLHLRALLVGFLCATLCGCNKSSHFTAADVAQRVFGGSEHMAAVSSASRVIAYAFHSKSDALSASDSVLAGYAETEKASLSDSQLVLIKQLLQQPTSYDIDRSSLCIPHYDILFVFDTSPRNIRVGLCFSCNQLAILLGDDRLNEVDDFSPMRPRLLSLAKSLFMGDPEIQKLK